MKCRYRKLCKKEFDYQNADDCSDEESWECPIYAKIDDLMLDAELAMRELREEEEVPFCEDYDGPVEEEEP